MDEAARGVSGNGAAACKGCGKEISKREDRLNAGLCSECFQQACAAAAREIAERLAGETAP